MKATELISIAKNTQTNDTISIILVVCLLVVCASKYLFAKNFKTLNNKTEYLSFTDDNTTFFSLIINIMMIVLVSTLVVSHFDVNLIRYPLSLPLRIGACFLLISGIMLIKLFIEMAFFKAFYNDSSISFFMKSSSYVNARNIIILLLCTFLYFYSDLDRNIIMIIWFILLCVNRVWEIYFRYANQITNNKSIWYYNILYLCTLEILPIMVLAKLLIMGKVI